MSILKHIAVFSSASLFKVLPLSILCVFFKIWAMFIMLGYYLVLFVCLEITERCYNLQKSELWRQMWDWVMSWLTITNLGKGKAAALYRLVSTLYWTITYTITLSVIQAICNTDPDIVNIDLARSLLGLGP